MVRFRLALIAFSAMSLGLSSCAHYCKKRSCCPSLPPGAVTTPPPGATVIPPTPVPAAAPPPATVPAFPGGPGISNFQSVAPVNGSPNTRVTSPALEMPVVTPDTRLKPEVAPPTVRLQSPDLSSPMPSMPSLSTPEPPPAPIPTVTDSSVPPLPVGIASFTAVKPQVASGQRPLLDGLNWLQASGYRGVLYVRKPGDDDASDRKQIEQRGMKYLSLEASPETLTSATVKEFNRWVTDAAVQPLFVYDRDGTTIGALWYLHFRLIDKLSDAEARRKAEPLGLPAAQSSESARTLEVAMQKILADLQR